MVLSSEDVLFVGKGTGVVAWYRCGMPSFNLGCDFIGLKGDPGNFFLVTSLKRGGHSMPRFEDYKIVILQQVSGQKWLREIARLRSLGVKVIYEVDDFLHGVRKIASHRAKDAYTKKKLVGFEMCMRACDAIICSTPWLAKRYAVFNRNIFVCKNGIEARRYSKFSLPERDTINIGWAGGEGHLESVRAWLPAIEQILDEYENTRFFSMGLPVADLIDLPGRSVSLPFIAIENFAGALTNFDIAIGPAGRNSFFQAKSDLRFLETGGLGIPLVADPFVYDDIVDAETGMLAEDPETAYACLSELIEDADCRHRIGQQARDHVLNERSIEKAVESWERVFIEVMS